MAKSNDLGEVAERPIASVLKTDNVAGRSRVQIPPSPLVFAVCKHLLLTIASGRLTDADVACLCVERDH